MPDLTDKALDALVKRLRDKIADAEAEYADDMEQGRHTGERPDLCEYGIILDLSEARQTADALTALRGGQEAMRRSASCLACDLAIEAAERAKAENLTPYQVGLFFGAETAARGLAEAIEALPLDAPAPVDPTGRFCNADGTVKNPADTSAVDPAWDRVAQGVFHEAPDPAAEAARVLLDAHRSALLKSHLKRSAREMALVNLGGKRLAFLAQENRHE